MKVVSSLHHSSEFPKMLSYYYSSTSKNCHFYVSSSLLVSIKLKMTHIIVLFECLTHQKQLSNDASSTAGVTIAQLKDNG